MVFLRDFLKAFVLLILTKVYFKRMNELTDGYVVKEYHQPVKRFCQTLDLKNNPQLIAMYRKAHSEEQAWPEILAGIREVGILEMEIYISGTKLFMIVETPLDFDWTEAMARLAKLPRQEEWEDYVSSFQNAQKGSKSSEKWQLVERMFHLYDK